jgi:anti-sigma factor RsiW
MNCYKARGWFGAYWDDEITQAERESVEAHFVACPKCRAEYESFARTLEGVASLPRHEAAPDFVERTVARARRASPVADSLRNPRPVWVPVAAAAAVLLVAVMFVAPRLTPLGPAGGPTANRGVPHEARLVAGVPTPVPAPAASVPTGGTNSKPESQEQVAALVDSLVDHSEDVDFVLDPVRVGHERTAGRRLEPVQGHQAVISF